MFYIVGLEEAILTNSEAYTTTVICSSTAEGMNKAQLYRMDAAVFKQRV